jgi:hypothetical protein
MFFSPIGAVLVMAFGARGGEHDGSVVDAADDEARAQQERPGTPAGNDIRLR